MTLEAMQMMIIIGKIDQKEKGGIFQVTSGCHMHLDVQYSVCRLFNASLTIAIRVTGI